MFHPLYHKDHFALLTQTGGIQETFLNILLKVSNMPTAHITPKREKAHQNLMKIRNETSCPFPSSLLATVLGVLATAVTLLKDVKGIESRKENKTALLCR